MPRARAVTVDYALARSPLADWAERFAELPSVITLAEVPFVGQLNLRLDPRGPAAEDEVPRRKRPPRR